jgi:hypothetical protein
LTRSQYGVIPGYFVPSQKDITVICPTYYLTKPELQNSCAGEETLVEEARSSPRALGSFTVSFIALPPQEGTSQMVWIPSQRL